MIPPIRPKVSGPLDTSNFDDFPGAETKYGITNSRHQVVKDPSYLAFHDYGYRRDLEAKKPSVRAALSSAVISNREHRSPVESHSPGDSPELLHEEISTAYTASRSPVSLSRATLPELIGAQAPSPATRFRLVHAVENLEGLDDSPAVINTAESSKSSTAPATNPTTACSSPGAVSRTIPSVSANGVATFVELSTTGKPKEHSASAAVSKPVSPSAVQHASASSMIAGPYTQVGPNCMTSAAWGFRGGAYPADMLSGISQLPVTSSTHGPHGIHGALPLPPQPLPTYSSSNSIRPAPQPKSPFMAHAAPPPAGAYGQTIMLPLSTPGSSSPWGSQATAQIFVAPRPGMGSQAIGSHAMGPHVTGGSQ